MSDIWDSVPTQSYRAEDGRTVNPYRTFGPKTQPGVSWHEYFKAHRALYHKPEEEEVDEEEYEIVITREAEEFDEPCGPLATWVKRAHESGWKIHTLAHAFSTQKQPPFKGSRDPTRTMKRNGSSLRSLGLGGQRFTICSTMASQTPRP